MRGFDPPWSANASGPDPPRDTLQEPQLSAKQSAEKSATALTIVRAAFFFGFFPCCFLFFPRFLGFDGFHWCNGSDNSSDNNNSTIIIHNHYIIIYNSSIPDQDQADPSSVLFVLLILLLLKRDQARRASPIEVCYLYNQHEWWYHSTMELNQTRQLEDFLTSDTCV